MKILRAFYYYQAISCWGNVPFTTDYTETGYPEQKSREYIFNYLEKEINDNIEFLDRSLQILIMDGPHKLPLIAFLRKCI